MTTDEAFDRLKSAFYYHFKGAWADSAAKAELGRILAAVRRETVEACAAVARGFNDCGAMFGPANIGGETQFYDQPEDMKLRIAAAILALVKEDGR